MSAPRWARRLLAWLAPSDIADEVVGDLEEAHRRRRSKHTALVASTLTGLDALDMAVALLRRRGLPSISLIDLKLSLRMLVKHPGLSLVSVFGMAVAVAIGAVAWGVVNAITNSELPLHEGDRIVTVQNAMQGGLWNRAETHLHSLETWRTQVPAFAEVGAYRGIMRNLIGDDGGVAPGRVAEMTASGFRIARVPPLLGRYFSGADERPGAPDVAVIGHGIWQDRFGGAPDVIGRTIQIGATRHAIVGVMPRDFAFPVNDRVWTPLRLRPVDFPVGAAPPVQVFARLAPDATLRSANAQLAAMADRLEGVGDLDAGRPTPTAFPYTQELFWGLGARLLQAGQLLVLGILVVIAINVSTLVYARTVSRTDELSVRTALGASRRRIVSQFFTEAFLLSALAALAGLLVAGQVLERIGVVFQAGGRAPFWWDFGLPSSALLYAFGAATLAATIIGVVPALRVAGRRLQLQLKRSGSGASRPTLGRTWTGLIAVQIAAAVSILPMALSGLGKLAHLEPAETTMPLDEVLVAQVSLDLEPTGGSAEERAEEWQRRYTERVTELRRRLEAWPQVARVALMGKAPWQDPDVAFEVDGRDVTGLTGTVMESAATGHRVGKSVVGAEIFQVVDVPALEGRLPAVQDAVEGGTDIVVNQVFKDLILKGGPAVGTRIRFPSRTNPELGDRSDLDGVGQPWYTIVGVVPSFPPPGGLANPEAKAYLPLTPAWEGEVVLALRARSGNAGEIAGQVRSFVADVDPLLRLSDVATLATRYEGTTSQYPVLVWTVVVIALSVLLLAVAGLYALMSFTVARRRREIGIRIALGARHSSVLSSIVLAATWQLGIGVVIGLVGSGVFDRFLGGELLGRQETILLPGVAVLMAVIGVLAAWVPTRQALRIQPTEALGSE
ncbi:MAG: ABC transporter permease [Longimicrobiales bacterium]